MSDIRSRSSLLIAFTAATSSWAILPLRTFTETRVSEAFSLNAATISRASAMAACSASALSSLHSRPNAETAHCRVMRVRTALRSLAAAACSSGSVITRVVFHCARSSPSSVTCAPSISTFW